MAPSMTIPSAGILSPACRYTMSPTTTSLTWISCSLPSRRTLTISLASSSSLSADAFPSCLFSLIDATPLAIKIATRMPTGSNHSDCPRKKSTTCTTSATRRIMIMGSLKPSRIFFHSGSGGICVRVFAPCCCRLSSTCFAVKPGCFIFSFPFCLFSMMDYLAVDKKTVMISARSIWLVKRYRRHIKAPTIAQKAITKRTDLTMVRLDSCIASSSPFSNSLFWLKSKPIYRILYMPHILLINSFGYMLRARSILRVELLVSKNNRSDK